MAHDVFISYSSNDKPTADAVCAALESRGIRCWIAPRDVLAGEQYASALVKALRSSRLMVLVFSSGANESDHVLREVERAANKRLPIVPLRIENVLPSEEMEYYISSRHWLDALTPPLENHLIQLGETVKLLLARLADAQVGKQAGQAIQTVPATGPAAERVVSTELSDDEPGAPAAEHTFSAPATRSAWSQGAVPSSAEGGPQPLREVEPPRVVPPKVARPSADNSSDRDRKSVSPGQVQAGMAKGLSFKELLGLSGIKIRWVVAMGFLAAMIIRAIVDHLCGALDFGLLHGWHAFAFAFTTGSWILPPLLYDTALGACALAAFRYIRNAVAASVAGGLAAAAVAGLLLETRTTTAIFLANWFRGALFLAAISWVAGRYRRWAFAMWVAAFGAGVLGWAPFVSLAQRGHYGPTPVPFIIGGLAAENAAFVLVLWFLAWRIPAEPSGSSSAVERAPQPERTT